MIRKTFDYRPLREIYDERDKNKSRLVKPGEVIELDKNCDYEIVPDSVELHEAQGGDAGGELISYKIIMTKK